MIEEVEQLLDKGLKYEDFHYYGLEYRYVADYLHKKLNYNDMYQKLRSSIFKFSKRQMTWFRRMENRGISIYWLDVKDGLELNLEKMMNQLKLNID